MAPKISVILPIYNSAKYLSKALDSVEAQTFEDWELLAINDYGSDDGSAEIVRVYEKRDPRIKLVQNEVRLGLAESLNEGFRLAAGEYLARLDADDIAYPDRFEKQVAYLDKHPEIGACGTYQHHFGANTDWTHKPPVTPEDMKVALVFQCNICHSTLMLRRSVFIENDLYYDASRYAEDFELWSRAIQVTEFATLPEVLGEYRKGEDNITATKKAALIAESGQIVAATLKRMLGLELTEEQARLFQGWVNPFKEESDLGKRRKDLKELEAVLREIYARNEEVGAFAPASLINAIAVEWNHAVKDSSRMWSGGKLANTIDEVFEKTREKIPGQPKAAEKPEEGKEEESEALSAAEEEAALPEGTAGRLRFLVDRRLRKPVVRWLRRVAAKLNKDSTEALQKQLRTAEADVKKQVKASAKTTRKSVENWTWDRYWRTNQDLKKLKKQIDKSVEDRVQAGCEKIREEYRLAREGMWAPAYVSWSQGETLRVGIEVQGPEEWESIRSVWTALSADSRYAPRVYVTEREPGGAPNQAARALLREEHVPFTEMERYTLLHDRPHVYIRQTAEDRKRGPEYLQGDKLAELGIRIAYIPCWPELTEEEVRDDRPGGSGLTTRPWRQFTLSEAMRFDRICYSPRGGQHVLAVGHPRFDMPARRGLEALPPEVRERIKGRTPVLIEMHTPETGAEKLAMAEGDMNSYVEFLEHAAEYKDKFFFLAATGEGYLEYYRDRGEKKQTAVLRQLLEETENVLWIDGGDCRPALYASEYVIGDRSALLLEAAALGVPVLYMSNIYYKEPLLPSVEAVFRSFYQGAVAYDIRFFLDFVAEKGNDYKKPERQEAAEQYLPAQDGKNGERVVRAIAEAVCKEAREDA